MGDVTKELLIRKYTARNTYARKRIKVKITLIVTILRKTRKKKSNQNKQKEIIKSRAETSKTENKNNR